MSFFCLTCNNSLSEYEESQDDIIKSAESCTIEVEDVEGVEDHNFKFLYCKKCWTLHVYCHECNHFIQLFERSCHMNKNGIVSWRDNKGRYNYTSIENEFALYDKNTYIKPRLSSSCFIGKTGEISKITDPVELYETIYNYIMHNFPEKFYVNDLKLQCLDPNNEQLISKEEKGVAFYGNGFNIMKQAFAKWKCEHGCVIVNGD